jgi:predicted porin
MPVFAQNKADVAELQRIIEAQQRQLEAQQKQLDAQRQLLQQIQAQTQALVEDAGKEVDRLGHVVKEQQQQLASLQKQVDQTPTAAPPPTQPILVKPAEEDTRGPFQASATKPVEKPPEKVVTSAGGERVKLAISGHVNRMVSIIDDGESTDTYFVDNDASESQVRFVGTAKVSDDVTLGGTIELSIAPNKSGNVDQLNQDVGDVFDQRKAEVILDSKRWGKLSLGKGFTASYGTGAVDLSKTSVISYATIVDLAGSMLFRERDSGDFTDIRIFNAFNSFDGLSRQNRLRYDTANFGGFRLAASAINEDRYDAALRWGGQGYGLRAAGAGAIANPKLDDTDLQYNGSFSLLHENTGLNATLAFGLLDRTDQGDQQNYFAKVGWLKRFFSVGDTAFSLDYTRSLNLPTDSDDGYSIAAAAAQQFDKYGAELFALYRLHSLDRDIEPKVEDISVVSIGTRVKF